MDRNQEGSRQLLEETKSLLEKNKYLELRELLEEYHVMDIIDMMEELDEDLKIKVFDTLPIDLAAQVLEESNIEFFKGFIIQTDPEHVKNILENMSLGDMANILKELELEGREKIINFLNEDDASSVRELLYYEEETAGSTMTKGYVAVYKDMNAAQAIKVVRDDGEDADTIYYIYVIDEEEKLVGVVSLKELITSRDSTTVEDLMFENMIYVYDYEDREEAVKLVSKYDLLAIPVVDREKHLKGIIMVDDIIDVIEEENTEDMYKFAGSSEHERDTYEDENSTLKDQVFSALRGRLPWLILTVLGGIMAAKVFQLFEPYMSFTHEPVFFYIPLVIGMAGNVGSQSSSVTAITLNSNDGNFQAQSFVKELVVGLIAGAICSIIAGLGVYFMEMDKTLWLIVCLSIFINMTVGSIIGVLIPYAFSKADSDVTVISAPLITTILDIVGIAIYLILTLLIINKF